MAEKKFFVDINLQGSALTNATIGTNSSMTKAGSFRYNEGRLEYYDGVLNSIQEVANLRDIAAVTGGLIFQGGYDPTTDTPDITNGDAYKGFFWAATVAGTFLGESVQVGDSIVAKVDGAGATAADWLILQGNIVIATDSVDGISRLATQTEANDGTEGGAVVITPATLQGKIDAQITPEISNKLPLAGGTMSGTLDMGNNTITNVSSIYVNGVLAGSLSTDSGLPIEVNEHLHLNDGKTLTGVPLPTDGGDAANKTYVDDQDALKLSLTGGVMSGTINMSGNDIENINYINASRVVPTYLGDGGTSIITIDGPSLSLENLGTITNLPAPTNGGDATNKTYVDNAASTAESNANAYTDSKSTAVFVNTEDWILDGTTYIYVIQNTLDGNLIINTVCGNRPAEFEFYDSNGTIYLYSNVLPTQQVRVNIMQVS
jgi:hypothetical protein